MSTPLAAVAPAAASADGLPLYGVDIGSTGVATSDGAWRYVTLPARGATVVARVEQEGGVVAARRTLEGTFTVPAVAYDGSADGLSRDGSTLVLIAPRRAFPRARTTFAVIDAPTMRVRTTVRLRGDFSFDAISPDGASMYLTHYLSPTDPTEYEIRAYDLVAGRLRVRPIVDPTEPDEQMGGTPVTRATSPDGRWAYTLYQRGDAYPFIHALDTLGRTARCIDLEFPGYDLSASRLDVDPGEGTIRLLQGATVMAAVDTATFEVTAFPAEVEAATTDADARWLLPVSIAGGVAVLLVTGLPAARRRRLRISEGVAGGRVATVEAGPEPLDPLVR